MALTIYNIFVDTEDVEVASCHLSVKDVPDLLDTAGSYQGMLLSFFFISRGTLYHTFMAINILY